VSTSLVVLGVGAAAVLAWMYNRLVSARLRVREAWGAVDVQLQRRASLIPNLVESVQGYAAWERDTMQRVVEARGALAGATGPRGAARANDDLSRALGTLFAVAEAYPELQASERFAQLQSDLADTENRIAFARNYYNGAVETFNIRVESFPGLLVARAFGFRPADFFSAGA
jgi:LemA protein